MFFLSLFLKVRRPAIVSQPDTRLRAQRGMSVGVPIQQARCVISPSSERPLIRNKAVAENMRGALGITPGPV